LWTKQALWEHPKTSVNYQEEGPLLNLYANEREELNTTFTTLLRPAFYGLAKFFADYCAAAPQNRPKGRL
jgi:hypothetical protein